MRRLYILNSGGILMTEKYKAAVSCRNIYREVPIDRSSETVRIGTIGKCTVRFDRRQFLKTFMLKSSLIMIDGF